jgi:hypothetical protein
VHVQPTCDTKRASTAAAALWMLVADPEAEPSDPRSNRSGGQSSEWSWWSEADSNHRPFAFQPKGPSQCRPSPNHTTADVHRGSTRQAQAGRSERHPCPVPICVCSVPICVPYRRAHQVLQDRQPTTCEAPRLPWATTTRHPVVQTRRRGGQARQCVATNRSRARSSEGRCGGAAATDPTAMEARPT